MMKALLLTLAIFTTTLFSNELINTKAPLFFSKNINSPKKEFVKLQSEIEKGNGVVLAFFASWCAPCKKELPFLESLQTESGVAVIAISLDDRWSETEKKMVADMGFTAPVLHDKYKMISKQYKYEGKLPYTIYIDKSGLIKATSSEYSQSLQNQIKAKVISLTK